MLRNFYTNINPLNDPQQKLQYRNNALSEQVQQQKPYFRIVIQIGIPTTLVVKHQLQVTVC